MPSIFSVLAATCAQIVKTLSYAKLARYLTAVCCFVVIAGLLFDASRAAHAVRGWLAGNAGNVKSLTGHRTRATIAPPSRTIATANGSLNIERSGHTATYLGDSKVLLVGGDDIGTAEIYDAAHDTAYYTGSLSAARRGHTATKMPDGRVLIAGGSSSDGGTLDATEIYDAATGSFSAGISLKAARSGHTATVLADGRTVFIGGDAQGSAEIFDPQTGRVELLKATLDGQRAGHATALLQNGKILIVGGTRGEAELNTAELFDPATLTFAPARNAMRGARVRPNLRVLPDGKVQVIGGDEAGSMEMFNAGGGYFTAYAWLIDNAVGRAKTLRANTRSGLFHKRTPVATDTPLGTLSEVLDRADYSLTEIPRHTMVAGGVNSSGNALRSVVMLDASSATVTTDQTDYQPGEFVTITGGGWLPGESVSLTLHRDNETPDTTLNATVDADGNITNSDYLVQASDLNVAFLLTAVGQTSGYTAQTTFTDSVNPINITAPVSTSPVTVTSLPATIPITFTYSTGATGITSAFVAVKDFSGATIAASPSQFIPTSTSTTSATINVTIPGGTANANNYSAFAQVTNTAAPGTITQQDTKNSAVIVDVPVPVKLAFITLPFTAIAGQCGSPAALPITVQSQDAGGNKAQSTTNTTVNLTSSSAGGVFYSDAQCTRAVTGVVISNAGNSAGFYYKDTIDGTPTITAADAASALTSATQTETIVAPPSACASPGFAAAMNFVVGDQHLSVAVGDFNADGKADVVAVNSGTNTVSRLLGNGAGGFTAATNFTVGTSPRSVALGDFNADGKADIATANQNSNNVSILLGNGAGGFAAATNFAVGSLPNSVAVGDFNADGRADVVAANFNSTAVSILLNNGAGGFTAATNFTVGSSSLSVAVGDFNGDGKADVVAANFGSASVSVLLGNGAGSFAAAVNFAVGPTPVSVAVGDFNADGKPDIATANGNSSNVSILLGNGLGGFAAATNFAVGFNLTNPTAMAIGDFNADGNADIATTSTGANNSNNYSLLLGNGAGGFAPATNFAVATIPRAIAVGDFNGDGKADLTITGQTSSNVSILLNSCISAPDLTITKTHSGNLTIGTNASYALTVSNAAGAAATSGTITVTDTLPTGLSFVSGTGTGWSCSASGQNVTCANSNSLAAGASSPALTLTVNVGSGTAVGTNSITNTASVSVTGETNTGNNSASDPTTVNKGDQTITFGALADKSYGDADFAVSATASSGLTVSYAAGGNCTVSGTTVHITGAGNCTIAASQAGNASYNAAPDVMQSFTVNSKTLTANITAANKVYDRTTAATILTRTLTGVVGTDDVTLMGGTATFDNKNVGTGKTVTAIGLTLSGTAAGNYVLSSTTTTTTADITPRTLNVSATAQNKTYDGSTAATVTLSDDRVSGDDLTTSYTTASFADKNVGANKPVSVSGISISGVDALNYALNTIALTTADITALAITGNITAANKVYDGNISATILTRTLTGVVSGDVVSYSGGAATFADKNVSTSKTVTATGLSLSGPDAGNYTVNSTATTSADITQRTLTVTATAANKVYDGNANASVTLFDDRFVGDVQTVSFTSALFDDANIGANKTVTISGIAMSGVDAGNYMPAATVVTTIANITPAGTTMVSVSPSTVQYSDTVTFIANITPTNTSLIGQVAGTVQFCINGADFGAPVAAVFTSAGAIAALTFNNQLSPGNYTVAAKFISANPNFGNSNSVDVPLTVMREDARVFYNGMLFVNTNCGTCSDATVQLAATVKDITAVTGDAAFDANAGDISNATLTFVNMDTNDDIATVPISLVSAGDTTVGTAAYNWSVNLNSADSSDYTIGFRVNGYYTRYAGSDDELVTVSRPLGTNFITGGGYLVMTSPMTSSAGQYAGAPGLNTSFSFNIKYANSGKSLQGRVNVIVRGSDGRVYQFEGNQMDTLTVNNANPQWRTAAYTGRCTLTDITDKHAPIPLGDGHAIQMRMTDKGEPGSSADIIGITVYANTNGALLFSSNWNGTTTIEQLLGGGHISVK